uniref:DNA 3'-5' helicase n=1 Tax=Culex tarsalis TaxID=7177 RepID=A0A1Q3F1T2_CULTA
MSDDTPKPEHLAALESYFGHSGFRPMQWRIIRSIIEERRDNCVIMATGYGKSLTYQFPSVFLGRLTLVVSPLISLMEDQVLSLNLGNIPACLLGSAQRANLVPDIRDGKFRVVYVTPEYLTGDTGRYLLEQVVGQLVLIAIDEAHCLSKWGHDFRPAYRNLGVVRRICPQVPILAVTATATPNVREDIVASLGLRKPQVLCTGFDRPNLQFNVRMKSPLGFWEDVKGLLSRNTEGSVIIYCLTRKQTDEIVETLRSSKVKCEAYHAGLTLKQRREVHESFVRDRVQIIVATIAFGMGIDKPDVRLVIHYGASKDLESYYQEAGRAGRDGQPSKCVMFWSRADFKTHEFLRENTPGGQQKNLEVLSKKMHEYLDTRDCRRQFILKYFEGDAVKPAQTSQKNCCDNCDRTSSGVKDSERYEGIDESGQYDFTQDTEHLLKAIDAFGGGTGIALPIALLRGSKSKKLNESYLRNPLHGVGKARDEEWWKALAALLEREAFLNKVKVPNTFNKFAVIYKVQMTPAAKRWLETPNRKLRMKPTAEMFKSIRLVRTQPLFETASGTQSSDFQFQPKTASATTFRQLLPIPGSSAASRLLPSLPDTGSSSKQQQQQEADPVQELMKTLLKKRTELASTYECMPYMIASNLALQQLATLRPQNLEEMKQAKLDGFSDIKIHKFGRELLSCVRRKNCVREELVEEDVGGSSSSRSMSSIQQALLEHPLAKTKFSSTFQTTWNMWQEGRSLAEIAKVRGLAEGTLTGHLCEAIKHGFPFDWTQLARMDIDRGLYRHIKANLPHSLEGVKLTDVKNACMPNVTFDQIKLVLNHVHVRQHLRSLNVPFDDPEMEVKPKPQAPTKPQVTTSATTVGSEDLWGDDDDDDVAESSFAEIDRICEQQAAADTENRKPNISTVTIEDDDGDFDMDEIAALEQAVINDVTMRGPAEPKRVAYEEEEDEPSPAKKAKVEAEKETTSGGNIFRFKTASSGAAGLNRKPNKRIMYDDDDSEDEQNGTAATHLAPLRRTKV